MKRVLLLLMCVVAVSVAYSKTIKIKHVKTRAIIFEGAYSSKKEAVQAAIKQGVSLAYANLKKADLSGLNLQGANLDYANLREANLAGANLYSATFWSADLFGAKKEGVTYIDINTPAMASKPVAPQENK